MPIFAIANAGIKFSSDFIQVFAEPIVLGILFGLFIGKPLGITSFAYIMIKSGIAELPKGLNFQHIIGVSMLAGIGFTMSTFIASLSFSGELLDQAKFGIFFASMLSAVTGFFVLKRAIANQKIITKH